MSIKYCHSFMYPEGRSNQNQYYMDNCIQHKQQTRNQNSGSTRFRSAPSSYQESIFTDSDNGGDENQLIQSPSKELEDLLASYYGIEENCMKEEEKEFVSQPSGYAYGNGSEMMPGDLSKWSNGNLSSEPSSSNPRVTPRISGIDQQNAPNFCNESWDKTSFGFLNGSGGNNINFSGLNTSGTHTGKSKNRLTHHLSLPASFSNKSTAGNLLQFQETVQFKTRAKRGFATHPRSIAERERRTRISERIRKLQDLVPNMDKQTSTAEMLDMAVEHIKELQKQVKALTDTRARCSCASKEKQIGNCS